MQEPSRPWVVMKFGGTSVSTRARWETIGEEAMAHLRQGRRPLVVCSALSGVSNALERLLDKTRTGNHEAELAKIKTQHEELGQVLGVSTHDLLGALFFSLERLTLGAHLTQEVSPRLHAQVMSTGELMSTTLGHAFLMAQGLSVDWVDARDCLQARPAPSPWQQYVSAECDFAPDHALEARLRAMDADILLTQGFISRLPSGDTALLGRGGSDTSASTFASLLGAQRCEIWTDVPGMFSANPRDLPQARLLRSLDYAEAQEIASTGAKVLHPRCIAPVRAAQIPLHIRCTQRPEMEGTVISARHSHDGGQVKAISTRNGQVLVSMDTPGMWQQVGFLADVFACFKRHQISIDLVSTSEMNVTVSLDPASNPWDASKKQHLIQDLEQHCKVSVVEPCATISLVGREIRTILHQLGPALEVFEAQQIYLVSQAASDLNLSFVVDEKQAERLVKRLHQMLFEGQEASALGVSWSELFADEATPHEDIQAQPAWWETRREDLLEVGQSYAPCYIYDAATLRGAAQRLLGLRHISRVFFAMKANPCSEILRLFEAMGLGFECVSPGELARVHTLFPSIEPSRILFTPNFAARDEYETAYSIGAWVTLDNLHPLEHWPEVFAGKDILVRLDPGQGRGHHAHVKTAGENSKFGVSALELGRLESLTKKHKVRVVGFHAHCGSGILTPENWSQTARSLIQAAERFPDVRILNLGGGLGVPEARNRRGLDLNALDDTLASVRQARPDLELWLEPGRYLVAQAGVLLAQVTQHKRKGETLYVGVNTGMNSLIRPALYGAWHEIVNLSRLDQPEDTLAHVVGPICESGDTLGWNRSLANPEEGDLLLISTAGAYGHAMSSQYNLRPPAQEILLEEEA